MPSSQIVSLARSFSSRDRERGEEYFRDKRIGRITRDGNVFRIQVAGEDLYTVELKFEAGSVSGSCTCPWAMGDGSGRCKHIWASLLYLDHNRILPPAARKWEDYGDEWIEEDDEDFDELRPPFSTPAFRLLQGGRGKQPGDTRTWERFFDALSVSSVQRPARARELPQEIVYALGGTPYPHIPATLTTWGRSRNKSGGWRKWKRVTIPFSQFDELEAFDRETLGLLHARSYRVETDPSASISRSIAGWWIERLARAGKLVRTPDSGDIEPIPWLDGPPCRFEIHITAEQNSYRMSGSMTRGDAVVAFDRIRNVFPGVVVFDDGATRLDRNEDIAWVDAMRRTGSFVVPKADRGRLLKALIEAPPIRTQLPPDLNWEIVEAAPQPVLTLYSQAWRSEWEAHVSFRYDSWSVPAGSEKLQQIEGERVIRRDLAAEERLMARFRSLPVTRSFEAWTIRAGSFESVVQTLQPEGWTILANGSPLRSADAFDVEIESGIDWFDLHARATYGDTRVDLSSLLEAVERNEPFVKLPDGSVGLVPKQWASSLVPVAEFGSRAKGAIRYRKSQAFLVDALLRQHEPHADPTFAQLRRKLNDVAPEPKHEPAGFRGTLREYQRTGLGWFDFLRAIEIGGCLADDMGLGKTVQVLALLEAIRASDGAPSLVVAPKSLLFNWVAEAQKFAPELRVLQHHGGDRTKSAKHFAGYDLVLTTYATMRLDIEHFTGTEFEYVILDEAQAIKNPSAQAAKAARLLRGRHRLALSGTPIENHLGELWSIFEFLNPGMLGPVRTFNRMFAGKNVPPERREALARALRPLILRRTKEQVAPELPARTEQTLYCELEGKQKALYIALRDSYRQSLLGTIRDKGLAKSQMHILEALLRLRQAACHPALIDEKFGSESAKLDLLMEELYDVKESGHRALIFSQFTSFLQLLRHRLDGRIRYAYLDGKTKNRQEIVEDFQSENGPPFFLISLKAGGLGLNLTNADYVFLLDPWWNPAVEAQAIDRSHRIGQTRPVVAYRIIARDTVEEKILELQARKRELADSIISEDNSVLRKLQVEDIELLLS